MSTGERIKLARQALAVEPAALAAAVKIPEADLADYESDRKQPEPEVIWTIAQHLRMELGFFLRQMPVVKILALPTLQALEISPREIVQAQVRVWLERYLDIESFLPVEEIPWLTYPAGFPASASSPKEAAEAAERLRDAWQLGSHSLGDIADLLESFGIKVGWIEGAAGFDACAFWTDDELQLPMIALRRSLSGDAQRFIMARELAYLAVEGVTPQTANHFAGAFLIPAQALRRDLGASRTQIALSELQFLRQKYGVSMRRLLTRAASLRIIPRELHDQVLDTFRKNDWMEIEPGPHIQPDLPARMTRLALRLQAQGALTQEQAAEMLGVSLDAWHTLLNFQDTPEQARA